jgi:hypothetical protein
METLPNLEVHSSSWDTVACIMGKFMRFFRYRLEDQRHTPTSYMTNVSPMTATCKLFVRGNSKALINRISSHTFLRHLQVDVCSRCRPSQSGVWHYLTTHRCCRLQDEFQPPQHLHHVPLKDIKRSANLDSSVMCDSYEDESVAIGSNATDGGISSVAL